MPGHADPRVTKSLMFSADWKPAPVPEEGVWGQGDRLHGALTCLQYWLLTAARTSEGSPYTSQTLLLEQGLWGDVISVFKFVALVLLQWPGSAPPQKGGDGSSSKFVALNLYRCVALIANNMWNLATESLCISPAPPPQLELATWKASGDSKGRKCPWNTATKAHGQNLCLSRGVGTGNNTPGGQPD